MGFDTIMNAVAYVKAHKAAVENWAEGEIAEVWLENGIVCVKYESGNWWHYARNAEGEIEWW